MTTRPEPMDKLDAAATAVAVVNGPEDDALGWSAVRWRKVEDDVRRLRQRIFTAMQAGGLKRGRNLQKMMLRSPANTVGRGGRGGGIKAGRVTPGGGGQAG